MTDTSPPSHAPVVTTTTQTSVTESTTTTPTLPQPVTPTIEVRQIDATQAGYDTPQSQRVHPVMVALILLMLGLLFIAGMAWFALYNVRQAQRTIIQTQQDGIVRGLKIRAVDCLVLEKDGVHVPVCDDPDVRQFMAGSTVTKSP